jgi:hypothetical protein
MALKKPILFSYKVAIKIVKLKQKDQGFIFSLCFSVWRKLALHEEESKIRLIFIYGLCV